MNGYDDGDQSGTHAGNGHKDNPRARIDRPSGGHAKVAWTRCDLAKGLAALNGVTLHDVKSTVGDPRDSNNWRKYLGDADDLMAFLSSASAIEPQSGTE